MNPSYRILGHESFPCRYSLLPKAVRGLVDNPMLFLDEDAAMVTLGIGETYSRAYPTDAFWRSSSRMTPTSEVRGLFGGVHVVLVRPQTRTRPLTQIAWYR